MSLFPKKVEYPFKEYPGSSKLNNGSEW